VQRHEGEYVTRDLFIVFDAAFENSVQYSRALKSALSGQHATSRGDLERDGFSAWEADMQAFPDSAHGFMQALRSFGGAYHAAIGHLVCVFVPSDVSNAAHFAGWLTRAVAAGLPERLRLLALDSLEAPRLADLRTGEPDLTRFETLELDATAVAAETFAQERTVGPAGPFRNMLMGLFTLIEKGTSDQVQGRATEALAYARQQGWKDQQIVVTMLVAAARQKEQRFDDAITAYRNARAMAVMIEQDGHPAATAMTVQAWFGEAGAQLAAGRLREAAVAYDTAALAAQAAPNLVLAIEACRMAAFCHARLGEREEALARGSQALATGERLRAEVRGMTTLPCAATDLLRVLDEPAMQALDDVRARAGERTDRLVDAFEQQAARHERRADADATRSAEMALAGERHRVAREAEQELQTLIAAADPRFQQAFARARRVLGTWWPLGAAATSVGTAADAAQREAAAA
jgi:hypothetical protein